MGCMLPSQVWVILFRLDSWCCWVHNITSFDHFGKRAFSGLGITVFLHPSMFITIDMHTHRQLADIQTWRERRYMHISYCRGETWEGHEDEGEHKNEIRLWKVFLLMSAHWNRYNINIVSWFASHSSTPVTRPEKKKGQFSDFMSTYTWNHSRISPPVETKKQTPQLQG